MRLKRLANTMGLLLVAGLVCASGLAAQETQEPSVADAARKAREQKGNAAKPAKVITDDTFAPSGTTNTIGGTPAVGTSANSAGDTSGAAQTQPATASAPAASTNDDSSNGGTPKGGETDTKVAALKEELAKLQNEVDLSQRELTLDNETYYSKPNYAGDKAGKTKLDELAADLKLKQDDVDKVKAKLAEALAAIGGGTTAPKP
jgi:hypothetical protein